MDIVRYVLLGIDAILCLMLIVLMLLQNDSGDGASGTIVGASSDSYLSNNKDRSRDAKLRRTTIVSGILFMVITYVLGLLYLI